jgi:hypothetical protein
VHDERIQRKRDERIGRSGESFYKRKFWSARSIIAAFANQGFLPAGDGVVAVLTTGTPTETTATLPSQEGWLSLPAGCGFEAELK